MGNSAKNKLKDKQIPTALHIHLDDSTDEEDHYISNNNVESEAKKKSNEKTMFLYKR